MSIPSSEQLASDYVPPPILLWLLSLRALTRTASGKEGGQNTKTEVSMEAWHEGLQRLSLLYAAIDEDEDHN